MKQKLKEALLMFCIQIVSYSLMCINFRAVAAANYPQSLTSDFLIASLSFFVIRKIAKSDDTLHQWIGYALGGVVGSALGIWISTLMLHG